MRGWWWRRRGGGGVRWHHTATQALLLYLLTFCVLLPLCCHRLLYSYYFLSSAYLDAMSEDALQESLRRGQEALSFWQSSPPAFTDVAPEPQLLVTVVTAPRGEGRDFHYLLQVMRRLSELLGGCGERRCAEVVLCDVDGGEGNEDAKLLRGKFHVIGGRERRREDANTFEREKKDYAFCLRQAFRSLRPRNMVVLEDDALPRHDFFGVLADLLSRRFAAHTLYVKLYHPERLQRYWNPEPYRILEWCGLGLLGASLMLLTLPSWTFCFSHLLLLAIYVMAAVELLGRHYLLELRRLSPQLYAVSPATECCTPAILYPGDASLRAAHYLDGAFCSPGNAKDMLLYHLARSVAGERAHSVEPNLVSHIGAFSSIRLNPARPKLL
ncbi:post-GPI attachment to proteins factor 4 [Nerophis lumbriciformis]|uniref:post-GPI attachment to proteins factor 4 n=1 Tax=Nerophis lumbriciformis TaxID=546530 RepID=UPI002ADF2756|nr:transmembrane protein 246 [Nerophis lumbriciformis]